MTRQHKLTAIYGKPIVALGHDVRLSSKNSREEASGKKDMGFRDKEE